MALKDITLGQYFPGHSLIHRFDPRGKIIFTVIYIVAIFLCNSLLSYGIALAVLLILIAISKVPFQSFRKGMKPVIFLVIVPCCGATASSPSRWRASGGLVSWWRGSSCSSPAPSC